MALTKFALELLAPHLRSAKVLAFGYPDLLMTRAEASAILGCKPLDRTSPHGAAHKTEVEIADTAEAFEAAGVTSLYCVDLMPSRGVETVVDLNEPLWPQILPLNLYDLVIDAGTIEHCANIGQALMNAARMVVDGGRVFHSPPVSMLNHGFYNVCPTLLVDFYEQNGWEVEHLSAFRIKDFVGYEIPRKSRGAVEPESALYFLARRGESSRPLRWPTQGRYLTK